MLGVYEEGDEREVIASRKIQVEIVGDSRSVERAFKRANKAGTGFDKTMRGIAFGAGAAIGTAFVGVGLALRRGFREVSDSQKVLAQTNAVLKSTGQIAGVTAKDVSKLSAALSAKSGIDDEAIQTAENMLLTFTNIRGKKIFAETTKAALDMSVALGKDLPDSAMMIGKAMNDLVVTSQGNVRGFMALRRVGVQISPAMMAQAAAFIEANKPMEAQLLLLKELQTEFGGSAAAFGQTLPGVTGRLSNSIDEITGAFVQGLVPALKLAANWLNKKLADPAFVARVREIGQLVGVKLVVAFKAVSDWFGANWPKIQGGFRTLSTIIRGIGRHMGTLKEAITTLTAPLRIQLKILLAIWDKVLAAIGAGAGLLSNLPGFLGGNKFKGVQEAAEGMRQALRDPTGQNSGGQKTGKKTPRPSLGGFPDRRARGGPVRAGSAYLVGERGPEVFVPGMSGGIIPNGGGETIVLNVYVGTRKIATEILGELQRVGKRGAGQSRGRLGGQNIALG